MDPETDLPDEFQADISTADDAEVPSQPSCATRYVQAVSDAELILWIEQASEHNEKALALLYDALVSKVYGLVIRMTGQRQLAEEVTEDVFWQIWRQAARFDAARGSPRAWIMTMARSRSLDALRCQKPTGSFEHEADEQEGDPALDPIDLLVAVERNTELHAALGKIEALPRQLVALAFFKGDISFTAPFVL